MTAVSQPRRLESLVTFLQELKSCILEEAAGAALCVVHGKVSRKRKGAISLKMMILFYKITWHHTSEAHNLQCLSHSLQVFCNWPNRRSSLNVFLVLFVQLMAMHGVKLFV